MSNGLVTGLVKSVRESSFMLDDGRWYGIHPDSELETPNVGDFAVVSYWTKSSKHNGSWRTFHNVSAIKSVNLRVDFRETNSVLDKAVPKFKIVPHKEQPAAAAADFDDDIPF